MAFWKSLQIPLISSAHLASPVRLQSSFVGKALSATRGLAPGGLGTSSSQAFAVAPLSILGWLLLRYPSWKPRVTRRTEMTQMSKRSTRRTQPSQPTIGSEKQPGLVNGVVAALSRLFPR